MEPCPFCGAVVEPLEDGDMLICPACGGAGRAATSPMESDAYGRTHLPPDAHAPRPTEPSRPTGMAGTALGLAIPGLCLGALFSIPGLVLGSVALRRARRGTAGGAGMATTAIVLGAVGTLFGTLLMVGVIALALDLSNDLDSAPTMTFAADEEARTLEVLSIDPPGVVTWWDVDVHGCQDRESGRVRPGQVVRGCRGPVTVVYVPTGQTMHTATFPA